MEERATSWNDKWQRRVLRVAVILHLINVNVYYESGIDVCSERLDRHL
jgi:hypothetical protein